MVLCRIKHPFVFGMSLLTKPQFLLAEVSEETDESPSGEGPVKYW